MAEWSGKKLERQLKQGALINSTQLCNVDLKNNKARKENLFFFKKQKYKAVFFTIVLTEIHNRYEK